MNSRMRAAVSAMAVIVALSVGTGEIRADEGQKPEDDTREVVAADEDAAVDDEQPFDAPGPPGAGEGVEEGVAAAQTPDQPPQRQRSWRWLIGGQSFELLAGTIWYVLDEETNEVDWDYAGIYTGDATEVEEGNLAPRQLKPQRERWRGLDGFRFEDNVMVLNTPLHPMAGAGYHILARSSSLGVGASALTANISSLLWEGAIEHQEVFSINDQFLTATGGVPLGEAYFQLGHFFRSAEPTRLNRTMAWIFGVPSQLRDRIHGYDPLYVDGQGWDERGWPTDIWHRFTIEPRFSIASTRAEGADDFGEARYDGELAVGMTLSRLPDYRRSGEHGDWLTGPLYSTLSANLAMGEDVYDWGLKSELDFAGYYHHDVEGEDAAIRRGSSLFVGTGMGFRHVQHRYDDVGAYDDGRFLDRHGIVHFPGLRVDASWFTGLADVHLRYAATPDFSAIETRAYRDFWAAGEEDYQGFQTVVEKEGYYYGAGFSSLLDLEVTIDPVYLHWGWDLHWARSIDRADRFKDADEFLRYLSMTDLVSTHEVGAMVDLPVSNMRAGIQGEYRQRGGTLEDAGAEGGAGEVVESQTSEMRGLGVIQLVY